MGIPENAAFEDTIDTPAVNHITYCDMQDQKVRLEALLLDLKEKIFRQKILLFFHLRKDAIQSFNCWKGTISKIIL